MFNHVAQRCIKVVQRILFHKIYIPVPNRNIPLRVHLAEIPKQDLIALVVRFKMNRADRLIQAVLSKILHILNDK